MIHTKDKLLLKPRRIDFSELVLHPIVILLLLTNSCGGTVSSTDIDISKVTRGVMLDCRSEGWYPEPEVLWLDGEGNLLSAGPPETVRGHDDLYTVSSRVTLEKRHSNSFTCRVHQKNTNQTRDTHIHLTDDIFSGSAVRIIIVLLVCCVPIVAVAFIVWKWGQNKTKTSNSSKENQHLMEGEDIEKLMTTCERMKYLDDTKVKLNEDLRRTDGELQHVEQVITTLTNQKKDLINQRGKLTSLHQDDKIQIEENKKNKKKEKKNPTTDKDKKKNKYKETMKDFERRKRDHKELLKNTDKQLKRTEEMINKMTEKKEKLERDKEQMNKHLEEMKRGASEETSSGLKKRTKIIHHPMSLYDCFS